MEEKKNKMKTYQLIISFLLVIVFIAIIIYAFYKQNDILNTIVEQNKTQISQKNEESTGTELDFNSELVQTIFPLTGAFPGNDMRYIANIKNMNLQNITNDFILKLGWAKVTNEDLASSYQGEGTTSIIDSKILDKYIKDIFGEDIKYTKGNFSNTNLRLENSSTSLYNITYNIEDDKYYIDFIEGDANKDSFILMMYPKAIQYEDKLEISIHPLYIKNLGVSQNTNGLYEFSYVAYQHYNFETKSFIGRLTDTMSTVYEENLEGDKEAKLNDTILGVKEKALETYVFTYKLNRETNKYEFFSLSYE